MTLYREQLVDQVVAVLLAAATDAGTSVYAARDWPLTEPQLPSIMVKSPVERKQSLVKGVPQFETVASIAILARTAGVTSAAVETELSNLCQQIETAVLSSGSPVQMMVEEFESVDTDIRTTSEGAKPAGDALIVIACRFYELFEPTGGDVLDQISITMETGTGATISGAVNTADPGSVPTTQPTIFGA